MLIFKETEEKISQDKIAKVEKLLNFRFPIEYKNHILKHNGGRCEPNVFEFIENDKKTSGAIHYLLAIYEGECDNLVKYFNIYKIDEKRMPERFFPIAHDAGGNLICMDSISNKIYFWDHDMEVDYSEKDDDNMENMYFIADSLELFLLELCLVLK